MKFLPVVDNIQMEGTLPQILDIGPSFLFYDKTRETFCNCFFDIYSLLHKMKINTAIKILRHYSLQIHHENS